MRLRVNQPSVISESIDGEAVIIALSTGTYYSARGPSARAWDGLAAGLSVDEVVADLRRTFATDGVDVAAELTTFIEALEAEQLVVPDAVDADGEGLPAAGPGLPWASLALETFTDMQELILLDPVHEVEPSQGWPVARTADPPA